MNRYCKWLSLGLALAVASPVYAQMSFEGLDLSGSKKKKKGAKRPNNKRERPSRGASESPSSSAEEKAGKDETPPLPPGGLDLSKPTAEESKPSAPVPLEEKADRPKKGAAPTMTFEAVDVSGKSSDRQRMDQAVQQFKSEEYEQSVMSAHELMQDPKLAGLHLEAQYLMAKALYRMGLYHSALGQFSKILAKGPQTKFFKTSLEWLFFISHKTTNETVILDEIAKYANFEFPEKFRNEFRYLLARYHFVRGKALDEAEQKPEADKSFDEVKRLVLLIPRKDPFFPRAKYLEGLAYFREDNFNAALESMKEVVRLTRPGGNKTAAQAKLDQELRELAFMQLARTHYGHRQNRYAIYYYGKVERGNTQWLEALFEASWANYRVGQYEQALGNLITLSSPFFREEYFPEALILKAVIYYENCRYKESTIILEDFERIYLPVHDQLEQLLKKDMDASEYYNVLADIQKKNKEGTLDPSSTDFILERILRLALTDKDLKKTNDSILELEAEVDGIGSRSDTFKYSDLSKTLIENLKLQREALIKKAGIMAKGKLETELGELKKLLANGLRIKFETTTKEKEFLEAQLQAGGKLDINKKYKFSPAVPDDHLFWPYVGEYWRDELGTYQYTLTKGCIEKPSSRRDSETASLQ